jgi:hypothetical protein
MKSVSYKKIIFAVLLQLLTATVFSQKYENGTRLLKGAEVLSATPLQLDYVLETLADTAKITVNIHEGKTHLVLNDGSGTWREWWYHMGRWKVKNTAIPEHANSIIYGAFTPFITGGNSATYTLSTGSYGKYWIYDRMIYIEINIVINSVSGSQTSSDIMIGVPEALSPKNVGGGELNPAICIIQHGSILTSSYSQLGGYFDSNSGVIKLTQSGTSTPAMVKTLKANAQIRFSITYML